MDGRHGQVVSVPLGEGESISAEEMRALRLNGYAPVLRWQKQNVGHTVTCSTGEALKNIELEAARPRRAK